ncbi:MAG: class I SAM-dependent DNA methyltransferase [Clostridia bacterium]|nr:class I SAM-dependent DNA methyltransferase [Clostridia bacterium]
MTEAEKRTAAKQFAKEWAGRGDEKQETQMFWVTLLQKVYGVQNLDDFIKFEVTVKLGHDSYIDAYIKPTHVLIEQKGKEIDLTRSYRQSDGSMLTPYQQARRYAGNLPHNENPRWIVVCNFREFHIHDMNRPNDAPDVLLLSDLEKEFSRLNFLVDTGDENVKREMKLSMQAGELVGQLYDAFLKAYIDPTADATLKSLNALCVRLVFCLYAEDAGIFGRHGMFHDYMQRRGLANARRALIELFRVLDTEKEKRDPYLEDDLAAFPYVNGGLFRDENIEIPRISQEIFDILLSRASADFDWSEISPTIFGAVFESTLNPDTRRKGGMHYTSIENIHKVIDPLFLDDLKAELKEIMAEPVQRARMSRLKAYHQKLASLTFLDPAAGSGNFLTETYLCLRRLENEVIAGEIALRKTRHADELTQGGQQIAWGGEAMADVDYILVSISQFYGIEINDFAVSVARTALWIAESQMMKETESIIHMDLDFLPLKTNAFIHEGNALRMDWESVVPKDRLNYIMGNPPFVGARLMGESQKADVLAIFGAKWKNAGNLDYVCCWYKKAADMMKDTGIRAALVSTNSVTQGESVANLWKPLFEQGVHIDFAHRTFRWDSEAAMKAHVHCVIVGFSIAENEKMPTIYDGDKAKLVGNINGYLIDAENVFIDSRGAPICDVPNIVIGSQPIDDGNYLFDYEEMMQFIEIEPAAKQFFHKWYGSREFINQTPRYCLYLGECTPNELRAMPHCLKRVKDVQEFRLKSNRDSTVKAAQYPTKFGMTSIPDNDYIILPKVSSERRRYVPMGFLPPDTLCSDLVFLIPDATLYHFGVLTSNVHMAWMRTVCGRLKSDYRYSKDIVYNNFPWPAPTETQKAKIEQTAKAILDARAQFPDCSLADLYDELTMPPALRTAHQQNDKAVWEAYGKAWNIKSESDCVAYLMKLYQKLTSQEGGKAHAQP